jgi:SET domain-containing protein
MDRKMPPADVWCDDRVLLRDSPIEGRGLFASENIDEGDTVLCLGGRLVTSVELQALFDAAAKDPQAMYIDTITVFDDAHLVLPPATMVHFANHSCDPNLWHSGPYEVVARRSIPAGEELTIDYGTHSGADGLLMECRCGAPTCRHLITSADWQIAELQARYRDHWTPALQTRIGRR